MGVYIGVLNYLICVDLNLNEYAYKYIHVFILYRYINTLENKVVENLTWAEFSIKCNRKQSAVL